MNIQANRLKQPAGPAEAVARHPYILLLLLFYAVAGTAAGLSAAAVAQLVPGELAAFFEAFAGGAYHVLPAFLRSAALNLLFYCLACLPRLWPPLLVVGGLSVSLKAFCMGVSLRCMLTELGIRGLALGLPLCVLPSLFCMAALALRMLADSKNEAGPLQGSLVLRSYGFLALCILLESAAAPVALRAWFIK